MFMQNTLLDNSSDLLCMGNALRQCIKDPDVNMIRIATGFWDIPGTAVVADELREFLKRDGARLCLLIGKDPYVYSHMLSNPKYKGLKYPDDFLRVGLDELVKELKDEYREVLELLLDYCGGEHPKIHIRIYKREQAEECQFLHSKCYIFSHLDKSRDKGVAAIVGSSNFTKKGLMENAELNYLETSRQYIEFDAPDCKGHIAWFEEKWAESIDWTKEYIEQILKPSKPVEVLQEGEEKIITPYELYIKFLQYKFRDIVDIDVTRQIESYLPPQYSRLRFQVDAVKQCFNIMHEHGGFMLGDVVGLGKTIVGIMIVKHFLSVPDVDEREHRVLIVTPPAIRKVWEDTIDDFDNGRDDKVLPFVDFITTGSIGKLLDHNEESDLLDSGTDSAIDSGQFESELQQVNYGLIMIDESHRFRNNDTDMYKKLDELIGNIWDRTGKYPYVGLLSATPQNNRPKDLQNQIYLFERSHANSTLRRAMGGNLESFFAGINKRYEDVIRSRKEDFKLEDGNRTDRTLKEEITKISTEIRDKILDDILVRRTRTDVKKYYNDDIQASEIKFPDVEPPISWQYTLSPPLAKLFTETMDIICPDTGGPQDATGLGYYRYRAIEYLKNADHRRLYEGGNIRAERVSEQLAGIMQFLLVKRLESSFDAFRKSLSNLEQYTNNMVEMWYNDCIFICPLLGVNAELEKQRREFPQHSFKQWAEAIQSKIDRLTRAGRNKKNNNRCFSRADFDERYIKYLERDKHYLELLRKEWNSQKEDPKENVFRTELRKLLPADDTEKKVVIFTESVDTLESIKKVVEAEGISVLGVSARERDESKTQIEANFDANYKGTQSNDYRVLIATDVLAEGVNLHRADSIINYDTPWNATRLMQRIGRVNRIGSRTEKIHVYNFMPCDQGNNLIQLKRKAHTKIQSFHILFGSDNQVYTDDEEMINYDIQSLVDGEESPFLPYIRELQKFKNQYPSQYDYILHHTNPLDVATDVPPHESLFLIRNNATRGLYLMMDENENFSSLSLMDMLQHLRVPFDASIEQLPHDMEKRKRRAIRYFEGDFSRSFASSRQKKMDEARSIITNLTNLYKLSEDTIDLLRDVRSHLDNGNADICRFILKLGNDLLGDSKGLLSISNEEVDVGIRNKFEIYNNKIKNVYGKSTVMMALYK